MKRVGIITIIDNNNFGNRLQNYAVYKSLEKLGVTSETILNFNYDENSFINILKRKIKMISPLKKHKKLYKFIDFNKNIKFSKEVIDKTDNDFSKVNDYFDAYIVGSDQVWNPNFRRLNKLDLLEFTDKKKISFAASFGVDNINDYLNPNIINCFNKFDYLSVREESGKEIINSFLPKKKVEVLIDPTLLLSRKEWFFLVKEPNNKPKKKYVFCYFLGELSENVKNEIKRISDEYDYEIVNIFDENNPAFNSGPSEFLWYEKNAEAIFTDSFHSSVFAFIFNKPFVVFDREGDWKNISSRIDTFLKKFDMKDRRFDGKKIVDKSLICDYSKGYKILEKEKKKSISFLKKSLNIK